MDRSRARYIPWRKRDITNMLISEMESRENPQIQNFENFCEMLENIFHFQFRKELETLKDVYYPVNPDIPSKTTDPDVDLNSINTLLLETLRKVLNDANYDKISKEQIEMAYEDSALVGISVNINLDDYDYIEIFARGSRIDHFSIKKFFGLQKKEFDHKILERVLLIAKMKDGIESPIPEGKTIIKLFKDVPLEDLELLFPNSKVVMSLKDKLLLAVPAIAGGVPLLISKVIPALVVVFIIFSAWFGVKGTLEEDQMKQAIAALSALGALAGYVIKQFSKYKSRKFQFQKELSDNLYFRNLVNNAGVFYSLIDSAEEEEFKEAVIAYYFLSISEKPLKEEDLDSLIENWFLQSHGTDLDFECPDALKKLDKLGLLNKEADGSLSVISYEPALEKLDYLWDNYFTYNK